jgi:gamma-glutamylcyclotransferase (GGCT)/AIG2-like uncharacterized protein YtfP
MPDFREGDHPRGQPTNPGQFKEKPRSGRDASAGVALRDQAIPARTETFDWDADLTVERPFFVYGTLRSGLWNEGFFSRNCRRTPARLEGAVLTGTAIPFMSEGEGTVVGELVQVPEDEYEETRRTVDRLEGFRRQGSYSNNYHRVVAEIELDDGTIVEAYCYVVPETRGSDVTYGDFAEQIDESRGGTRKAEDDGWTAPVPDSKGITCRACRTVYHGDFNFYDGVCEGCIMEMS